MSIKEINNSQKFNVKNNQEISQQSENEMVAIFNNTQTNNLKNTAKRKLTFDNVTTKSTDNKSITVFNERVNSEKSGNGSLHTPTSLMDSDKSKSSRKRLWNDDDSIDVAEKNTTTKANPTEEKQESPSKKKLRTLTPALDREYYSFKGNFPSIPSSSPTEKLPPPTPVKKRTSPTSQTQTHSSLTVRRIKEKLFESANASSISPDNSVTEVEAKGSPKKKQKLFDDLNVGTENLRRSSRIGFNFDPVSFARGLEQEIKTQENSLVKIATDAIAYNRLVKNGQTFTLNHLANGSYMNVFHVEGDTSLIPGIDNKEIVIKVFNKKHLEKRISALEEMIKNIVQQYTLISHDKDLPVAHILNPETILTDGFIAQECIPEELGTINEELLQKLSSFFQKSVEGKLDLDLLPSNLRLRGNSPILIDFREENEDDDVVTDSEIGNLVQALTQWNQKFPGIAKVLAASFKTSRPTIYEKVMHSFLRKSY